MPGGRRVRVGDDRFDDRLVFLVGATVVHVCLGSDMYACMQ